MIISAVVRFLRLLSVNSQTCLRFTLILCVITKLRTALGKFGEFWAHIEHFLLAWVGRNHFVTTKFSKFSKEISDPSYHLSMMP